jgi:hypothetical protein
VAQDGRPDDPLAQEMRTSRRPEETKVEGGLPWLED